MPAYAPGPVDTDLSGRHRVLELLRRFGWNATSFQILEPDFQYWFDADACVAYVDTGAAWVVAGGPLASDERLGSVARRFVSEAEGCNRRVVFFAVEERLLRVFPMRSLQVGEQALWNPQAWDATVRQHRSLREQLRRARAKGVVVDRVPPSSIAGASPMRDELRALIGRWLETRPMPAMAFLVELEPFLFADERRYYVARVGGVLRGALVAVPVYMRGGWFFEDILRDPAAPNGTVELLIDAAMRDLARENAPLATLGLAPLAGDAPWLPIVRQLTRPFYNFAGLRRFKAKFRPLRWDPIFVAWPGRYPAPVALFDVLGAFARGHPVAFAAAATARRPEPALRILALLLVPWTAILASPRAARWFPSGTARAAWVVFDAFAVAALLRLSRRWNRALATATAAAIIADATLTVLQAARFNLPRARKWWEVLVIGAAVAAPILAASVLVGGLLRHPSEPAAREKS